MYIYKKNLKYKITFRWVLLYFTKLINNDHKKYKELTCFNSRISHMF